MLVSFQDQLGEHMQIHEVTQRSGGFGSAVGSAVGDELETLAFGSPITKYDKLDPTSKLAQPNAQRSTADQYAAAEKIRKDKLAANTKVAQNQMTAKLAAGSVPNSQMTNTPADPEVLDPVAKPAQKYTGINNNNVIDVDARVVPDTAQVAKLPQPAPAQLPKPAAAPNFIQTNRVKYQPATVNAPVANVPNVSSRPTISKPAAPVVNPAAAPVVYSLDGQPLNPNNPVHAKLIAQLQSAGVTKANTKTKTRATKR